MKSPTLVFIAALIVSVGAGAFEIEGFTDGMAKTAAKDRAAQKLLSVTWNDVDEIYGGIQPLRMDGLVFQFCGDLLVGVARTLGS